MAFLKGHPGRGFAPNAVRPKTRHVLPVQSRALVCSVSNPRLPMLPTVAIVGRPNVGKSTLFNRLARRQAAITHDEPGVTRDRVYTEATVDGRRVALVDTGGLEVFAEGEKGDVRAEIFAQAKEAVEAANAIVLVVDGREGLTTLDEEVATYVRQSGKPVLLAVNKVDSGSIEDELTAEFHALGFPMLAVSGAHGFQLRELRNLVANELLFGVEDDEGDDQEQGLRLAVLGRPNAGKSSLINSLVGEDRLIVSDVAGTTRDAVDVSLVKGDKRYIFVDTAGVRRRTRIEGGVEHLSVLRALKASKRAQVTVLVLDSTLGVTMQDKKLLSFLDKEKTPFIAIVSKADLVPKSERKKAMEYFKDALRLTPYAPIIFTSSLTGEGVKRILPAAEKLWAECQKRVGTGELNRVMRDIVTRHQPPVIKRRRAKFYYLTQVNVAPPVFMFFVNDPKLVKPSYTRYLEGQVRKSFGLTMAPVRVILRSSHDKPGHGRK